MDTKIWAWLGVAALVGAVACASEPLVEGSDAGASETTGADTGTTGEQDSGSSTCGDGVVDDGEGCDDGDANGAARACTHLCQVNVCGDGFAQLGVEECDDGNDDDADACTNQCTLPRCGDGVVQPGEQCDDGNEDDGDGCSSACMIPAPSQLAIGGLHSCVRYNTGEVYCWGDGEYGATGYGISGDIGSGQIGTHELSPVELGGPVVELVAGIAHTCARLEVGEVRCWGDNEHGQLGLGHTQTVGDDEAPTAAPAVSVGGEVVGITAGYYHTCARLEGGAVRCWGLGANGQLGYAGVDTIGDDELPSSVGDVELGGSAVALAAGYTHTCALLDDGALRCWGDGGLGYGDEATIGDDEDPATAGSVELDAPVSALAAGFGRTCVVLDDGGVRCWGFGNYGALGLPGVLELGETESPLSQGRVELGAAAAAIAAGPFHTCVTLEGGLLRCFGQGSFGQLGYANVDNVGDDETPASVGPVSLGGSVVELGAGIEHSCALLANGEVRCWGGNGDGQLGLGHVDTIGDDELPSEVPAVQLP